MTAKSDKRPLLSWANGPSSFIPTDGFKRVSVDCALDIDEREVHYSGEALEWDISTRTSVTLLFDAPWFTKREICLSIWATKPVTLKYSVTPTFLVSQLFHLVA